MAKPNFAAWELDPAAFDSVPVAERPAFLARFAVLAPSSHNSQPWRFLAGPDRIIVAPDLARALPQSDVNNRQLFLSLGCALENLCAAADYYGLEAAVDRFEFDGLPAWRVRLSGEPRTPAARKADHPAVFASRRRVNRNKFDSRMPEAAYLDALRGSAREHLRVDLIADEPLKGRVAAVVSEALIEAMDDNGFRQELSRYVRPNITGAMTGMPMYGFGMPTPPSFLAPTLVRLFNVNRLSRKEDEELLNRHTPVFALVSTHEDGPDAWVEAGRVFERAALLAESRGLSASPMAAAIQIGSHYRRLQELLATDFRPQMFFRLGYASAAPAHSPRLPAEMVTINGASS